MKMTETEDGRFTNSAQYRRMFDLNAVFRALQLVLSRPSVR